MGRGRSGCGVRGMKFLLKMFLAMLVIGACCTPWIGPSPHSVGFFAREPLYRRIILRMCSEGAHDRDPDCIHARAAAWGSH